MKAKFLAITALILGMVSCQKDQAGLDVIVDGEQETTINVSLPETTRANSALGAVDNGVLNDYDIRYILEIYDGENRIKRMVDVKDNSTSTAFDVRLIPGYPYTFVAWADFVEQGSVAYDVNDVEQDIDLYYETTGGLKAVTAILDNGKWVAMTEARDAYTGKHYEDSYSSASNITLELKRPFAKLRVVTTDVEDLKNLGNVTTTKVSVDYRTKVYTGFNALTAEANTADDLYAFEYVPNVYTETNQTDLTLLADYLFGTVNGTIQFDLTAKFSNGKETSTNFNTDIPLERNKVTTIKGNILTDGSNIKVDVGDDFENPNDPNYEYETISSDKEFIDAVNGNGGKYIVISDLHIAKAGDTVNTLSTSANTGKTVLINLNGKTITVDNKSNSAVVTLGGNDALIFSGEGEIVAAANSNKLVDGGQVVVTGAAEVDTAAADVVADVDALKYVLKNGGEFTFATDLESAEKLTVATDVVINGNGKTLTYTGADRAIDCPNSKNTNVTINDLRVVCTASYCQRGINFNNAGTLTLNKVNVSGTNVTYALNLPGSSDNCTVNINDSSLSGNIALNVWGENSTINTNNTIFTSVDNSTAEGYAAVKLNNDGATSAENSVINIVGGKIIAKDENDELSTAVSNATVNGVVNISESTEVIGNIIETVAVTVYEGYDQFYSFTTLQDAVDKVQKDNNGTIRLIKDVKLTESVTVATDDFAVVLDLNGKTITGTDTITGSFGLITNKGNLTVKNGKMTLVAENNRGWNAYSSVISNNPGGNLVVEDVTIEHLGGTDMAYGIDNLTNGKGTSAIVRINGATVKSTYRPIRQFLNGVEATNELYVNKDSRVESTGGNKAIWMQDPSKNANTGKLVVTEGAFVHSVYLDVTAGSTEWPVEVSVAASSLTDDSENKGIYTDGIPAGYAVENIDGVWTVNAYTVVATAEELTEALANGDDVSLSQDVNAESATTAPYGNKYAFKLDGGVINGNGHELYMECYGDDYGIMTSGGTIKNLTITEGCRAVMIMYPQEDVILDNVNIGGNGVLYPINTGEAGAEGVNLIVTNSTLAGWTSYGLIESATFTNVEFKQGTYYNNIYGRVFKPYVNTTLTDCTFIEHMNLDLSSLKAGHKIVMKNCKVNGQAVTASIFTIPTTDAQYDTELFTVDLPSWASSINDCVVFE